MEFHEQTDSLERLTTELHGRIVHIEFVLLPEVQSHHNQRKEEQSTIQISCSQNWSKSFRDWSKLPEDMWVEILCRISPKQVSRYKAVCMTWNRLITNVCIPRLYLSSDIYGFLNNSKSDPLLSFRYNQPPSIPELRPDDTCYRLIPSFPHVPYFLSICNGMLLFNDGRILQLFVCNPAVNQCVEIPPCPDGCRNMQYSSLAFDPIRSIHFKLVCFHCEGSPITFYVFSSESGRWDIHEVTFEHPAAVHRWYEHAVYLNGVLCYLSESKHLVCLGIDSMNVSAIDLPGNDAMKLLGLIGESRGHLYYSNHDHNTIFFWMLEGCSETAWICMLRICIQDMVANPRVGNMLKRQGISTFMHYALHLEANIIFIGTPKYIIAYDFSACELRGSWKMKGFKSPALDQRTLWLYRQCFVNLKGSDKTHNELYYPHTKRAEDKSSPREEAALDGGGEGEVLLSSTKSDVDERSIR